MSEEGGEVPVATIDDVAAAVLTVLGRMTTKKLQKLVYYSQAWHLARNGVRLFPDEIQAWREGPVVRTLYDRHRTKYEVHTWPDGDPTRLRDDELTTVRWVAATYGRFSAESLSRMTHAESPWRVARGLVPEGEPSQAPISDDIMRNFYANQVVEPDVAVALAAASSAIEGVELDDAWQEQLRQVADGRVTAEELIQREIGQHLSDR
jgi:uncharacterized phage-associated protein